MRKVFVRCPLCEEPSQREGCTFAVSEKAVDDEIHVFCCLTLPEKAKGK